MAKGLFYLWIFGFTLFFTQETFAVSIPEPTPVTDCPASIETWRHDVHLREFMRTHRCYCPSPTSDPVCKPIRKRRSRSYGTHSGSGFRSTGDWRTDITLMFVNSIMQGFMRGIQQGIQQSIAQREEMRKRALEEWRRKVKAQYREALEKYKEQSQLEFEKKKSYLLKNLKMPKDSKMMRKLLCSKYWSKRAEEVANSPLPDALERAEAYSKKAELAMMGDTSGCPEEVIYLRPPEPSVYNVEFRMGVLSLMSDEEERKKEELKELDEKLNELRSKLEEEKRKLESLRESATKKEESKTKEVNNEDNELLKEAMKKFEESKKALEKTEEERKKLQNELSAIQEIQKEIKSMEDIKR